MLDHHYEATAVIPAPADRVFDFAEDQRRRMGGSQMNIEFDKGRGQEVGSRIRLSGRVLGIQLSVEEYVTERNPPCRKVWETTAVPKLVVIGSYRMGFQITPQNDGSLLRVFIDYALPGDVPARWLGYIFGSYYTKWVYSANGERNSKAFRACVRNSTSGLTQIAVESLNRGASISTKP
jgi:hypothetical protein